MVVEVRGAGRFQVALGERGWVLHLGAATFELRVEARGTSDYGTGGEPEVRTELVLVDNASGPETPAEEK